MERVLSDIEPASLVLAVIILGIAGLLGYREWSDRRTRPAAMGTEDRVHLARRDRRRAIGLSILGVLAMGVVVGSRISPLIRHQPNPLFLATWLTIFALILGLLILALVDWFDLRRYA